jgi:hypothetical protein
LSPLRLAPRIGNSLFTGLLRSQARSAFPVRFDHLHCNQTATWLCSTFARAVLFQVPLQGKSESPVQLVRRVHSWGLAYNRRLRNRTHSRIRSRKRRSHGRSGGSWLNLSGRRRQDCEIWIDNYFFNGCAYAGLFERRHCGKQRQNVWV